MLRKKDRRKVSNIIVDPRALLRFSIPFLVLVIVGVATTMVIHWKVISALSDLQMISNFNPATSLSATEAISEITMIGMIGMFIFGCVCLLLWIIYSHRIFGPTVPIRKHIDKLIGGDYDSRIQLRSRDEFKDIAMDLNNLAEKLKELKV